jgi:hypothetical protein
MIRHSTIRSLVVLLLGPWFSAAVLASPSHRDFDAPFDVHDLNGSKKLREDANKLYEQCLAAITQFDERTKRGTMDKAAPKLISDTRVALERLSRLALELQLHGETAGVDFQLRQHAMNTIFGLAIGQFSASTAGQQQAERSRQALQKNAPARAAKLQMVNQLAQQKDWIRAFETIAGLYDDKLVGLHDETIALAVFLTLPEQQRIYDTYASAMSEITSNRNKLVRDEIIAQLEAVRMPQAPATARLLDQIRTAGMELRTSGTVQVGDQPRTGPQALSFFLDEWKKVQVAALRHRAIGWAQRVQIGRSGIVQPQADEGENERAYAEFCTQITAGLVVLIEADAARASAAEAPQLYQDYLNVLGPALSHISEPTFAKSVVAALDPLAAKSPTFASEVQAYQTATDEYLRWQARTAEAIAKVYQSKTPAFDALVLESAKSEANFSGLFEMREPVPREAQLIGTAPAVMAVLQQRVFDKPVWVRDVTGLPNKKFGIAKYYNRTYATAAWPNVAEAITKLKGELLVTAQAPPLSLLATTAIASAENGDFVEVGGLVKGLYLEGVVPRFAAFPESAWSLTALGPLPEEPQPAKLLNHVIIRCDLLPQWVHHRYFFTDLSSVSAPAAAVSSN